MKQRQFNLQRPDGATLAAYHWHKQDQAKMVLVVAHGMGEHANRYPEALAPLLDDGVHIYALDHRGHGNSIALSNNEPGRFGGGGFSDVVDDLHHLIQIAKTAYQSTPLILLGHSMGSFIAQALVLEQSELLDGLVLVGTADLAQLAESVVNSPDVLTTLNSKFEPARTPFDWLSRDNHEVDKYIADPLCGFGLEMESMMSLLSQGQRLADTGETEKIRAKLPIYIVVGSDDPLSCQLSSIEPLVERYRSVGLSPTIVSWPQGRHEILNETNRMQVVGHLHQWLRHSVGESSQSISA